MLRIVYNKMDLLKRKYKYDITNLDTSAKTFMNKLECIKELKEGDKLGIDGEKRMYIDEKSYIQGIKRWYYNQNRTDVLNILFDELKEYCLFLKFIDNAYKSSSKKDKHIIRSVIEDIIPFNNSIINGIYYLTLTYNEDEKHTSVLNIWKCSLDTSNAVLRSFISKR